MKVKFKPINQINKMNWNNLNLKEGSHHRQLDILDSYDFDRFLFEISFSFNEENITEQKLRDHFHKEVELKVQIAYELFEANLPQLLEIAKADKLDN